MLECCCSKHSAYGPCDGPIIEYYSEGRYVAFCRTHREKFPSPTSSITDDQGCRIHITREMYEQGCRPQCVSRNRPRIACSGTTDEYHCTDGAVIALCQAHRDDCEAVVRKFSGVPGCDT